jgi:hypothetical protein
MIKAILGNIAADLESENQRAVRVLNEKEEKI